MTWPAGPLTPMHGTIDWSEVVMDARAALKSCEAAFLARNWGEGEEYAWELKNAAAQLEEFGKIARRLAALGS